MNKYKKVIQSTNLTDNDLTKKLKGLIAEHEAAVQEFNEEKAKLGQMDENDPDYDELSQELAELEETILANDDELCEAILKFSNGRGQYQKMLEGRKKWMENKNTGGSANPAPAPAPAPTPTPVAAQGGVTVAEEKKEGGVGDWLFWGIMGGIGLFLGVKIYKNR